MYIFINNLQKIYIKFLKILSNTYYKHKHYLKQSSNDVYSRFESDEKSESYNYFKKYFYTSIFVSDEKIREYSIKKSLELNKGLEQNNNIFYLEFGVHKGISINFTFGISKIFPFNVGMQRSLPPLSLISLYFRLFNKTVSKLFIWYL